ncbi:citrate synthase [Kiritimatiella glycovorans]|uniref:Citrate synthase n=1 Tax=Kiritimatiella glycovorans TaxID=1307763 RepID=A0A0G3ECS5_9BACT|nr:citrate synthase [Kiritimatiella glycovorans]AKJ64108.1 Citrate synthase 1 [Kiritimatiella glycovorans]
MDNPRELGQARLSLDDTQISFPVIEGSEGERAVDIRKLRKETGLITYDPGFVNTGSCCSRVTFINGEEGILRYRGYDIEDLAEKCEFIDVAYLLVHGALPTEDEHRKFSRLLNEHSMIHEDMRHHFSFYPERAHPMAVLSAMVVSLSTFYPELEEGWDEETDITVCRLLSKLRTIAAFSYKKFIGEPIVQPKAGLKYTENFLNMMFNSPVSEFEVDPIIARALNKLLILHADHEQNCSASVVRMVGSAEANLYASISAGICALWGPLHGGANQHVIEMLEYIRSEENGDVSKVLERAKDKSDPFRMMGFGHRVYKAYDPRARVAKRICREVLNHLGHEDPLLDIAVELEQAALEDEYFKERNLYPNVDFYTGLTYRAIGIPTNMFTVMFAIGRIPGWIAQWQEMREDPHSRIGRPRQVYIGPTSDETSPIQM